MSEQPDSVSCRRCQSALSSAAQRIEVAGQHRRDVVNPGGHDFVIACFARAPGCVCAGPTAHEASWFPGMTWQRAFCRQCAWHVGWLFRDKSQRFFGLDVARVMVGG